MRVFASPELGDREVAPTEDGDQLLLQHRLLADDDLAMVAHRAMTGMSPSRCFLVRSTRGSGRSAADSAKRLVDLLR